MEHDLFDFAQAHADALAERLAEIGFGRGGAGLFGQIQRVSAQAQQLVRCVVKQHKKVS